MEDSQVESSSSGVWVPRLWVWFSALCVGLSLLRLLGRAGKPLARSLGLQSSGCDSRWGTGTEQELGVLAANSLVPEVASHQGQMAHLGCLGLPATLRARKAQPTRESSPRLSPGPRLLLPSPHPVPRQVRGLD